MGIYTPIITNIGLALITDSLLNGTPINLKYFAWGDGNGHLPTPSLTQTSLVHEVYRQTSVSVQLNTDNSNWLDITSSIPSNTGGFYIREIGVFTEDGELFAVSTHPTCYKSVVSEGSDMDFSDKLIIEITNLSSVNVQFVDSATWVTQDELKSHHHTGVGTSPTKVLLTNGAEVQGILPSTMVGAGNNSGNIPLSNGTVNTNLNADMLDGYQSGNTTGHIPISNGTVNTNLNADMLDGHHASEFALASSLDFSALLQTNGYQKLPSGLIVQWGTFTYLDGEDVITYFPISFDTECYIVELTLYYPNPGSTYAPTVSSKNINSFTACDNHLYGSLAHPCPTFWFAIGS